MRVVPDLLRERAKTHPDRMAAVVDEAGEITYREWDERSNAFARGLVARGVERGDRVALVFDNSRWIDYAIAYFGSQKAGAVAVPVSTRLTESERKQIIEHCEAQIEVTDAATFEQGRPTDDIQVEPRGLADILYTSGTTGLPKGVASTHENILASGRTSPEWDGLIFIHAIPLHTFAGTHAMMLLPLRAGMTNLVLPQFDADRYCALAEERGAAITYIVPAMALLLLRSGATERHDLGSMRVVMFGAAPMPPHALGRLAEAFPKARLVNLYGLTEAGGAVTAMRYDPARPGSVGRPSETTRLKILDGEIWLSQKGVAPREYYRDPEGTAQVFVDGWVRTGDLGYLDDDGYLYLIDRAKDLVIRGGMNISTLEVESVLQEHPAVAEAAVFAVPHEVLGEDVAAAVVLAGSASPDDIRQFAATRLADYKVPRRIVLVEELPRNALGKVLKRELRARA